MAQLQPTTLTVTPTIGDDWVNLPINPENIVRAYAESVQINGVDLNLYPAIHFDLVTGAVQYWIYALGDTATRDADLALVDAAIAPSPAATLIMKSGIVAFGSFAGSPQTAAVVFAAAFADNLYSVTITGEDGRTWTVQAKSAAGFTINSNSAVALTGNTFWQAIKVGES